MLVFYDATSKLMEKRSTKWGDEDPRLLQDALGGFLEGVGNMVGSAVLTRSPRSTHDGSDVSFYTS